MSSFENKKDMTETVIGFLGCGKISSAMCHGFANAETQFRPMKIMISHRNLEKSQALKTKYPDLIEIADNTDIVVNSNVIFIGLLPPQALSELPNLPFTLDKLVISMMAAVSHDQVLAWTKLPIANVVRTVPLPSSSRRTGPILSYPENSIAESILRIVGTPAVCHDESQMKTLVSITGLISPFYEMLRVTQDWAINNGVDPEIARLYVASFYSSLSSGADLSHESFADLCHEACTPSGLNEQALAQLRNTNHYADIEDSLSAILSRLQKK